MRTLILAASVATTAQSFSIRPLHTTHLTSQLHLVPSQADQLVAASTLVYKEEIEEEYAQDSTPTDAVAEDTTTDNDADDSTETQQSFVSRVFSLPASFVHPHRTENEVVYPVVGFQYVDDGKDGWRAFPTVSTAACRLPPHHEETYGWYRPGDVVPPDAAGASP